MAWSESFRQDDEALRGGSHYFWLGAPRTPRGGTTSTYVQHRAYPFYDFEQKYTFYRVEGCKWQLEFKSANSDDKGNCEFMIHVGYEWYLGNNYLNKELWERDGQMRVVINQLNSHGPTVARRSGYVNLRNFTPWPTEMVQNGTDHRQRMGFMPTNTGPSYSPALSFTWRNPYNHYASDGTLTDYPSQFQCRVRLTYYVSFWQPIPAAVPTPDPILEPTAEEDVKDFDEELDPLWQVPPE